MLETNSYDIKVKNQIWIIVRNLTLTAAAVCSIICIYNYINNSNEISYELSSFHTYDGYTSSINNDYLSIFPENYDENEGGFCVDSSNTLLSEGDYSVEVSYISDGNNKAYLQAGENVYEELFLPAGEQTISFDFTLNQPVEDARLRIYYNGRGSIHINSMRITCDKPIFSDWVMILVLIWFIVAIIFVIRKAYVDDLMTKTQLFEIGFVFLIGILSIPYLELVFKGIYWGTDTNFHNIRIEEIKSGIVGGQFPVVVAPSMCNWFGSMQPMLYPCTFLYPFALLRILNVSPVMVYKLAHIVVNILMCSTCYICVKRITKSIKAASVSLVAFAFSYYHLIMIGSTDWTYGMGIAIVFMFIAIMGAYEIFIGNKLSWPYLTIGMWGLMNSHILSTLFTVLIVGGIIIVYLRRSIKEERIKYLGYAIISAIPICLYRICSFLYVFFNFDLNTSVIKFNNYNAWLFSIKEFLSSPIATLPFISAILILIFIIVYRNSFSFEMGFICILLSIDILCIISISDILPWDKILSIQVIDTVFGYIQFPNRLFQIIIPLTVILLGIVIDRLENKVSNISKEIMLFVIVGILFSSIWSYKTEIYKIRGKEHAFSGSVIGDVLSFPAMKDYIPRGEGPDSFDGRTPYYSSENISIYEGTYKKNGVNISCEINNQDDEGFIDFPLFAYKGYVCRDDNQNEYELGVGKNQRLRVYFTKTEEPLHISITYKIPWAYNIFLILSFLSLIVLVIANKDFLARTKKVILNLLHID